MHIFLILLTAVVGLNFISLLVNQVFFSHELDNLVPAGKLVTVDGKQMHVCSMGDGEETIVLLPGFTVPLPSADFAPLMRELSKDYSVVCVEYFGVGFSDTIETPRTNENYTNEIRAALAVAGFSPPYILMPHSGSGVYCEYYATKYPEEVRAIIMLDTTSSAETSANIPKFVYRLGKLQQAVGLARPLNPILVSSTLGINEKNGYAPAEAASYTKFMNHYYNDTVADQLWRLNENIKELMGLPFLSGIPVLKLVAGETLRGKQTGEAYQNAHMARLGASAKWQTIEGNHFIYHGHVKEIHDAVDQFLQAMKTGQ